jgi:hypothetical protein
MRQILGFFAALGDIELRMSRAPANTALRDRVMRRQ